MVPAFLACVYLEKSESGAELLLYDYFLRLYCEKDRGLLIVRTVLGLLRIKAKGSQISSLNASEHMKDRNKFTE